MRKLCGSLLPYCAHRIVRSVIFLVRRSFVKLSRGDLVRLCCSPIRPHLECGPHLEGGSEHLECQAHQPPPHRFTPRMAPMWKHLHAASVHANPVETSKRKLDLNWVSMHPILTPPLKKCELKKNTFCFACIEFLRDQSILSINSSNGAWWMAPN